MTADKQDKKYRWGKEHVQRVLDYHNEKYVTRIEIKGKTQDIHPDLKGKSDWDWVCYDTETDNEVAVEVKKLTDPKLERRDNIIWQLLEEIRNDLSNKLPGTFTLYIDVPKNFYFPIGKTKELRIRQEFKNALCKAICETAQRLKLGEDRGLTPHITGQLPFALPNSFFCALQKMSDEGSVLVLGSGVTDFWPGKLNEHEFKKFEQLVSHANNEQLEVAKKEFNVKETFLVVICEGLRLANPYTVTDAFKRINPDSYSQINHVYYVSGKKVVEIPLPTL